MAKNTKWQYRNKKKLRKMHSVWKSCTIEEKKMIEKNWANRFEFRKTPMGVAPPNAIVENSRGMPAKDQKEA